MAACFEDGSLSWTGARGRTIDRRGCCSDPTTVLATGGASGTAPPLQGIALSPRGGVCSVVDWQTPAATADCSAVAPGFAGPAGHPASFALLSVR